MSAVEVNRLFEAIENQYESNGTIDPQQKAMLFSEMKKFKGGEKFVEQISEAFQQIENSVNSVSTFACSYHINNANTPIVMGTPGTAETPFRNKLKFNVALKVFRLFQFSCNVEASMTDDD